MILRKPAGVEGRGLRMVVLDANILIRAVLGERVRRILEPYSANVSFFAPDTAFAEAREHLPEILLKGRQSGTDNLELLLCAESTLKAPETDC